MQHKQKKVRPGLFNFFFTLVHIGKHAFNSQLMTCDGDEENKLNCGFFGLLLDKSIHIYRKGKFKGQKSNLFGPM